MIVNLPTKIPKNKCKIIITKTLIVVVSNKIAKKIISWNVF